MKKDKFSLVTFKIIISMISFDYKGRNHFFIIRI